MFPPALIRRRTFQALALVFALAGAPPVAAQFAPSLAPYVPPFLLSSLVLISVAQALVVWRTQWVLAKLFPGQQLSAPSLSASQRRAASAGAALGVLVSLVLVVFWVHSLL
jgi:hypothetical protein